MRTHFAILGLFLLFPITVFSQKRVSITIDDVPNTSLYKQHQYKSLLLSKLNVLNIPIAIFINEGLIYKTDSVTKNFDLLQNWAKQDYISLGNHSFSHARYSEVGIDSFSNEITRGEAITKALAHKNNKPLHHFRFPYNDLGKDSTQQAQVKVLLNKKGYTITPFSIESSDWMYNYLYKHYLNKRELEKAKEIGEEYVTKTLEYFSFFEMFAEEEYKREVSHIYICHDNALNADYLSKIVEQLRQRGYEFISLDEALKDKVYQQKNNYHKKWGISWFYRWMSDKNKSRQKMKQEPSIMKRYEEYNALQKESKE